MALDYNPDDAVRVWPAGNYDATLAKVEEKVSKRKPDGSGGNPMEVWTLEVWDANGEKQLISDYVVIPSATFKIKQLAVALGKEADFKARQFQASDYIGAGFIVELVVEKQDGYDDKNRVKKYLPGVSAEPAPAPQRPTRPQRQPVTSPPFSDNQEFKEDDIPF